MPEISESSRAKRLAEIADDIRGLPEVEHFQPGDIAEIAGGLFDEAVEQCKKFNGPEYRTLRLWLRRVKLRSPDDWQGACWKVAVDCLARELIGRHGVVGAIAPACGPIADLIDAEAEKVAAGSVHDRPGDIEGQNAGRGKSMTRAGKKGLTSGEFNVLAGDYLKKYATPDHRVRARELADYLKGQNPASTCSTKTVYGLPAWRTYQDELELRGEKGRKKKPRAVSFTKKIEATTGENDPELERLIAESEAENRSDPSPLEEDPPDAAPRRVRQRKRV